MKEYLCECNPCRKFEFDNCEREVEEDQNLDVEIEDYYFAEEDNGSQDEQIFDFVDIPSFVTLLTGANAEPLYFLKVIDKGIVDGTLSDKRDHIISPGTRYFTCHYLKTSIKKYTKNWTSYFWSYISHLTKFKIRMWR